MTTIEELCAKYPDLKAELAEGLQDFEDAADAAGWFTDEYNLDLNEEDILKTHLEGILK